MILLKPLFIDSHIMISFHQASEVFCNDLYRHLHKHGYRCWMVFFTIMFSHTHYLFLLLFRISAHMVVSVLNLTSIAIWRKTANHEAGTYGIKNASLALVVLTKQYGRTEKCRFECALLQYHKVPTLFLELEAVDDAWIKSIVNKTK